MVVSLVAEERRKYRSCKLMNLRREVDPRLVDVISATFEDPLEPSISSSAVSSTLQIIIAVYVSANG